MNKKTIFMLIFAIIIFLGAIAFLLSTISEAPVQNVSNTNNTSDSVSLTTTSGDTSNTARVLNDTSNTSNTSSDTLSDEEVDGIIHGIEHDSMIDFNFYDKDNNELKLSDYKNKAIAILFSDFVEENEKSVDYLSLLDYYYEKYNSSVEFFCIDKSKLVEASSNIKTFKDGNGIEKYSISELPQMIFIDDSGNIINKLSSVTLENLEANLDLIIGNY